MAQRRIPSSFQFRGYQAILRIGGFVAPLGEARLITSLLQFERNGLESRLLLICGVLCGLNSSLDCAPTNRPQNLVYNSLFGLGPRKGDARLSTVNDP
jgi:hypothetical protein